MQKHKDDTRKLDYWGEIELWKCSVCGHKNSNESDTCENWFSAIFRCWLRPFSFWRRRTLGRWPMVNVH